MNEARRYVMFLVVGLVAFVVAVPVLNALFTAGGPFDQLQQVVTGTEEVVSEGSSSAAALSARSFAEDRDAMCRFGVDTSFNAQLTAGGAVGLIDTGWEDTSSVMHRFFPITTPIIVPADPNPYKSADFADHGTRGGPYDPNGEIIERVYYVELEGEKYIVGFSEDSDTRRPDYDFDCVADEWVQGQAEFCTYTPDYPSNFPTSAITLSSGTATRIPAGGVSSLDLTGNNGVVLPAGSQFDLGTGNTVTDLRVASHSGGNYILGWNSQGSFPTSLAVCRADLAAASSGATGNVGVDHTAAVAAVEGRPGGISDGDARFPDISVYAPAFDASMPHCTFKPDAAFNARVTAGSDTIASKPWETTAGDTVVFQRVTDEIAVPANPNPYQRAEFADHAANGGPYTDQGFDVKYAWYIEHEGQKYVVGTVRSASSLNASTPDCTVEAGTIEEIEKCTYTASYPAGFPSTVPLVTNTDAVQISGSVSSGFYSLTAGTPVNPFPLGGGTVSHLRLLQPLQGDALIVGWRGASGSYAVGLHPCSSASDLSADLDGVDGHVAVSYTSRVEARAGRLSGSTDHADFQADAPTYASGLFGTCSWLPLAGQTITSDATGLNYQLPPAAGAPVDDAALPTVSSVPSGGGVWDLTLTDWPEPEFVAWYPGDAGERYIVALHGAGAGRFEVGSLGCDLSTGDKSQAGPAFGASGVYQVVAGYTVQTSAFPTTPGATCTWQPLAGQAVTRDVTGDNYQVVPAGGIVVDDLDAATSTSIQLQSGLYDVTLTDWDSPDSIAWLPGPNGERYVVGAASGAGFPPVTRTCVAAFGDKAAEDNASYQSGTSQSTSAYTVSLPSPVDVVVVTPTALTDSIYAPILTAIFALIPLGLLLAVGWYFIGLYNGSGGGSGGGNRRRRRS